MRLGPVEEHFTAVSALRESRQFGIKDSANVLHVFICSNDLKSMDITSILITCVCCAAVLHSNSYSGTTYMKAISFVVFFVFFSLFPPLSVEMKYDTVYWKCARKSRNDRGNKNQ